MSRLFLRVVSFAAFGVVAASPTFAWVKLVNCEVVRLSNMQAALTGVVVCEKSEPEEALSDLTKNRSGKIILTVRNPEPPNQYTVQSTVDKMTSLATQLLTTALGSNLKVELFGLSEPLTDGTFKLNTMEVTVKKP